MAKDALAISGIPLLPEGMNDNSPLNPDSSFYQTRGCHSLSELCLQRVNGKSLFQKFDSPVLAIHGDLRERIWIETTTQLLMLDSLAGEEEPPEDDMAIEDYILIRDERSQGVNGGSFQGNDGYYLRDLLVEVIDVGNFATLDTDDMTITLLAGTYRFRVSVPAYGVGRHKALLYNDTNDIVYVGSSESSDSVNPTTSRSIITGRFVIAASAVFKVYHVSSIGRVDDGFGIAMNEPDTFTGDSQEIYTIVEFWRAPGV